MKLDHLKEILVNSTSQPLSKQEFSCKDSNAVRCYMIDLSGFVITSNQPMSKVTVGDFLGVSDPDLMAHLVRDKHYFDGRPEFDYQALCETKVDCSVAGSASSVYAWAIASHVGSLVTHVLNQLISLTYQLNLTILSAIIALYLPSPTESSLLEFGNSIPEGLHRCTTRKLNWYLKNGPLVDGQQLEDNFKVFCSAMVDYTIEGSVERCKNDSDDDVTVTSEADKRPPAMEKKCDRLYHLYKVKGINAIVIVAEALRSAATATGAYHQFSDKPVEVTGPHCMLPNRYRKRPKLCYAQHEDEKTCSGSSAPTSVFVGTILLAVTALLLT